MIIMAIVMCMIINQMVCCSVVEHVTECVAVSRLHDDNGDCNVNDYQSNSALQCVIACCRVCCSESFAL